MIVLIFVFPVLIFIFFWKFLSVDGVLKPKKFCPHWGLNSWPRAQDSDVLSLVLYHSAIQAPCCKYLNLNDWGLQMTNTNCPINNSINCRTFHIMSRHNNNNNSDNSNQVTIRPSKCIKFQSGTPVLPSPLHPMYFVLSKPWPLEDVLLP